jgi:hypothetical protein
VSGTKGKRARVCACGAGRRAYIEQANLPAVAVKGGIVVRQKRRAELLRTVGHGRGSNCVRAQAARGMATWTIAN